MPWRGTAKRSLEPIRVLGYTIVMNATWKWIIGTSVATMLALGTLAYGGSLAATNAAQDEGQDDAVPTMVAEPVLEQPGEAPAGEASAEEGAREIEFRSNPVEQDVPPPRPQADPASDGLTIKSILPVSGVMKYGEWHWNERAAPAKGKLIVTVDLKARVISVFRDGHEIGTAVAMLGTEAHPTPTGTFPILWKQRHNVSEKYNNAPMPWSIFLTRDGIAIHGGSEVENGYASHGCIAVPDPFADRLFKIARKGDVVVITDGKMIGEGDKLI